MNIKVDNRISEHENVEIVTNLPSENNDIKANSNENLRTSNRKKYLSFNNAQLGILFNIFKNGLNYVYRFVPTLEKGNAFDFINKEYIYGLNMANLELEMMYTRHYDIDKNAYLDPLYNLYEKMNANRTLLLTNKYRSVIHAEFFDNVSVSNESIKLFKQVLNRIANGVFRCDAVDPYDAKRIMDLGVYSDMLTYINSKHNCTKYLTHKSFVKYVNYIIKNKYKIVQIPKELQQKFNQIGKYFNEIKTILKFNDKNGFYSYTADEIDIPVICKHEYMTFEGIPPAEISIDCYRQGKCKYCGQELNAYHEQIKESLPPRIYDLIYKYIATINENIEVDSLMYVLFNLLFDAIQANVKTSTVKNYDASVVAFAALFLYKIYTITKGKINYNNKVGKFLDSIKEYGSAVGWSQEKMNAILNDSRMFTNIENITNIIKEKIYTNDIKFLESLPLSIMFNQNVDPREKNKLIAKTKIQEFYLEGNDKMILFNDVLNKAIQSLWKFTNLNQFVKVINKINVEGHELIHCLPTCYRLDMGEEVKDPRNIFGENLSVDILLGLMPDIMYRNLSTVIENAHLEIAGKAFSSYASGLSCLVDDEKEIGATVIDIGGGTTSIATFRHGYPVYFSSLAVGGNNVTNDIAYGLTTSFAHAERLKTLHGCAFLSSQDNSEMINVYPVGEEDDSLIKQVPKSDLISIITPRIEEIFELVNHKFKEQGLGDISSHRVVLTGGGSQLSGIREVASMVLDKQVRLGKPKMWPTCRRICIILLFQHVLVCCCLL